MDIFFFMPFGFELILSKFETTIALAFSKIII